MDCHNLLPGVRAACWSHRYKKKIGVLDCEYFITKFLFGSVKTTTTTDHEYLFYYYFPSMVGEPGSPTWFQGRMKKNAQRPETISETYHGHHQRQSAPFFYLLTELPNASTLRSHRPFVLDNDIGKGCLSEQASVVFPLPRWHSCYLYFLSLIKIHPFLFLSSKNMVHA